MQETHFLLNIFSQYSPMTLIGILHYTYIYILSYHLLICIYIHIYVCVCLLIICIWCTNPASGFLQSSKSTTKTWDEQGASEKVRQVGLVHQISNETRMISCCVYGIYGDGIIRIRGKRIQQSSLYGTSVVIS